MTRKYEQFPVYSWKRASLLKVKLYCAVDRCPFALVDHKHPYTKSVAAGVAPVKWPANLAKVPHA